MPLDIQFIAVTPSEAERVKTLESGLANALTDAQNKADALTAMTQQKNAADEALEGANAMLEAERQALAKAVIVNRELSEQLQARPVMGITRKPTITKTDMRDVAGVTLANDLVSPDDNQYDRMRLNLMLIAGMGFNTGRWFTGKQELKKILALPETNVAHLPGFAKSLNITYGADTVDRVVWDTLKMEDDPRIDARSKVIAIGELEAYLKGLEKLAAFFVFNDANQYLNKLLYRDGTLERMVERVRSITPNMPLIASLTANALPGDYAMFDHLEAQTFGTPSEFKLFLGRKFDVFCIDGRKSVTKAYLQQIKPLFLAANPSAFFFYPTTVMDWLGMAAQMTEIREMVSKWWTLPR